MGLFCDNSMWAVGGLGNTWLATLIFIVVLLGAMLTVVAYLVLAERKVSAWIQDRVGPNRCGPFGLLQPLADVVKLFLKEDYTPKRVDRGLFWLAPIWVIVPALVGLAVVPLGGPVHVGGARVNLQLAAPSIGVLYVVAVGGLGVYGVVLGGWAGNSKYGFLGGMRAAAQLLSYEVPLVMALLSIVMLSGTLRLEEILHRQAGRWAGGLPMWNVFTQPLAFVIFFTAMLAESNRLPFDMPEAEQELVGGYHTEYSSMKFGLYFLAEYAHLIAGSAVLVVLFLGGWSFWGLSPEASTQTAWYHGLARMAVFMGKLGLVILLVMQIRWTLPRFRYDQVMRIAWLGLLPGAMLLLAVNAVLLHLQVRPWVYTLANVAVFLVMLLAAALSRAPITGRQRRLLDQDEDPNRERELAGA